MAAPTLREIGHSGDPASIPTNTCLLLTVEPFREPGCVCVDVKQHRWLLRAALSALTSSRVLTSESLQRYMRERSAAFIEDRTLPYGDVGDPT